MTAPSHFVLAGTAGIAPRLPTTDGEDVGGFAFTDNVNNPPRPNEHPSAKDFIQLERLVTCAWQMLPVLTFTIRKTDDVYTIENIVDVTGNIDQSLLASSLYQAQPYGSGMYMIRTRFGAGLLPPALRPPDCSALVYDGCHDIVIPAVRQVYVAPYYEVWTGVIGNDGTGLTNWRVNVKVYGEGSFAV